MKNCAKTACIFMGHVAHPESSHLFSFSSDGATKVVDGSFDTLQLPYVYFMFYILPFSFNSPSFRSSDVWYHLSSMFSTFFMHMNVSFVYCFWFRLNLYIFSKLLSWIYNWNNYWIFDWTRLRHLVHHRCLQMHDFLRWFEGFQIPTTSKSRCLKNVWFEVLIHFNDHNFVQ